jgi:hypothetical protein
MFAGFLLIISTTHWYVDKAESQFANRKAVGVVRRIAGLISESAHPREISAGDFAVQAYIAYVLRLTQLFTP